MPVAVDFLRAGFLPTFFLLFFTARAALIASSSKSGSGQKGGQLTLNLFWIQRLSRVESLQQEINSAFSLIARVVANETVVNMLAAHGAVDLCLLAVFIQFSEVDDPVLTFLS